MLITSNHGANKAMWRRFTICLAAVFAPLVLACAAAAKTLPILSGAGASPYSKGFGQVKPREIFLGGDPTGLVCNIHWETWGGPFAIGTATSWYVGPTQDVADGHFAPAVVVLYHLGFWNSKPAYTGYNWYFPQKGKTYGATVKPCKA